MKKILLISGLAFLLINNLKAQQVQTKNARFHDAIFMKDTSERIMDNVENLYAFNNNRPVHFYRSELPLPWIARDNFRSSAYGFSFMDKRHYYRIKTVRIKHFNNMSESKIEDWMADENFWLEESFVDVKIDIDPELEIEKWMTDKLFWEN